MPEESRIAFIAVRMAPGARTSEPQAIVVGSKAPWKQTRPDGKTIDWGPGQDWRYACYPLSALRERLKSGAPDDDLFEPKKNPPEHVPVHVLAASMKQPTGLLTSADRGTLDALGFSKSFLDTKVTVPAGGGADLVLQQGATGKAVRTLQGLLRTNGYPTLAVDGVFGPATAAAVRDFQAARGLAVDGVVGPQTWAALRGGCATGDGAPLEPTRRQTAIPLREVERVFFFSSDGGTAVKQPFAAFDAARFVDPKGDALPHPFAANVPKDSVPTGSRIILFPDFADDTRPGALTAIAIHVAIKVAINGHRVATAAEKKAIDRHDTRMLIDLAVRGGGTGEPLKNLWVTKPGTQEPAGPRGLRFDRMRLRCTLKPFGSAGSRSDPVELDNSDLLAFARDNSQARGKTNSEHANDDQFRVHHVPALAALGFLDGTPILVSREFGFRALGGNPKPGGGVKPDDTIDRIGWRFELWAFEYSKTFLKHTSLQPVVPDAVDAALPNTSVLFAEEQWFADVNLHLEPERAARTVLTARLSSNDTVSTEDKAVTKAALATLDECVRKVHAGLKAVQDGHPLSLLPRLQATDPGMPWHLIGAVSDRTPGTRPLFDPQTASKAGAPRRALLHTFEPRRRFNMWPGLSSAASLDVKPTVVKATFARLETDGRAYPRYDVELFVSRLPETRAEAEIASTDAPAFQPAVSADEPAAVALGMRLGLEVKKYLGVVPPTWTSGTAAKKGSRDLVIGALQFTLAEAVDHARTLAKSGLIVLRPLEPDGDGDPAQPSMGIDADVRLPIAAVGPAGEDEPQGATRVSARERRRRPLDQNRPDPDAPLLLSLKRPVPDAAVTLTLQSEEVATRDRDHTIALSLRSVSEEPAPAKPGERPRVLVIEPGPFRVAAIDYDEITGLASSANNEVAVWNESGEGGLSWRVRDEGQIVDLLLPPQVVGEAMEKNRSDLAARPKDVEPGKPAAARFGSLTQLKIDPTFAETGFREPGWNLRRILGSALQRNPGARLVNLRLELLYGLLARLRADGLWITEIAGAIGEPPVPLTDVFERPHLQRHAALIDAVLNAERRRIAVEKLWRARPDEDLRLEEGVSFLIRRRTRDNGVLRGPATPLRWPTPGGVPADPGGLIEKDILDATFSASEEDAESFPGGLAWAFESPNILMRVYGRPRSDAGSLRGVHLTSLGGYGSQRALFDERKSIVETETTQGRVQRYRLERIGRIACLWHPAKHVIVYERTVVPPAQFYNRPPIGRGQDEHLGRAIPRKVEEYVEILKPKRQYPEDAISLRACGFLVGAEFKSIKIRVDSSWGSDVRREGWQVPLWSTAFLGLRPNPNDPDDPVNLYPKPQICLNLAGEGGKEIPHEIAEPEKLYFYTSVVAGEDDNTDLWQPVRDVDFCDLPFPVTARVRTESADLSDTMLRAEPDHVPGYERFTIAFVPAKEAVALTHARVAGGPVAALRNVTIARAASHDAAAPTPVQDFGREIAAKAANARAEIDRRVGQVLGELEKLDRATDPAQLQDQAKKLLDDALGKLGADKLQDAIKNTQDQLKTFDGLTLPGGICEGLSAKLREQVQGQFNRLVIIAGDVLRQAAAAINERIDAAAGVAGVEIGRLNAVLEQGETIAGVLKDAEREAAAEPVQKRKEEIRKQALDVAKAATAALAAVVHEIRNGAEAAIKQRIALAEDRLDSLAGDLKADLLALRQRTHADLQAAKTLVGGGLDAQGAQLKDAVQAAATQAKAVLDQLTAAGATLNQQSIDAAKTLRTTLEPHRAKLREAMAKLEGSNAPAVARRILQALDIGVGALLAAAAEVENGAIGTATAPLVEQVKNAKTGIDGLKTAVDTRIDQAEGGVDRVASILEGILDAAFIKIDGILAQIPIKAIKDRLDEIGGSLTQLVDDALKPLELAITKLDGALAAAVPTVPIPATLVTAAKDVGKKAQDAIGSIRGTLAALNAAVEKGRQLVAGEVDKGAATVKVEVEQLATKVKDQLTILINDLSKTCEALEGFVKEIFKDATKIADTVNQWIGDTFDVAGYRKKLEDEVKTAIDGSAKTIAEIKAAAAAAAARITEEAEARARQLAGTIQETVRDITGGADLADLARRADGVYQKGDSALRALRALGDPPKTNNLGFNRPEVAYVLGEAKKLGIDMTPALALVNRAADQVAAVEQAGKAVGELLDSFGVRLPMNEIADQLIPEKLKGLSVSDLLPDMGGIDFKGLLQRVGFPDLDDSNAVKIRHGFEKATMRAWMEADLNVPFTEATPLLSIGPVEILIDTAKFTSQARLSAGVDGTERKMNGRIFGDWRVVCAGQSIITFRQTGLYFDESGKIDFRIQPDRIDIAEALRFVTDLMAATGKKGGVRIQPFVRGGIPSGVAATLDLVLPPIQTGALGISDLSLHILFGIAALPRFEIVCELSVGTRMAPFTLNVWILNGGGYLTQQLSYLPTSKPRPLMRYTLDIGVLVGLGLGFSFGVVSGGVWIQVGCAVAFTWVTGGGSTTAMRVFLLVRGNVDVAGLITAAIALLFEVTYDGERMIGAGTLTVSVKISMFYTLSVHEHVEYVFAGEKKGGEDGYSDGYC